MSGSLTIDYICRHDKFISPYYKGIFSKDCFISHGFEKFYNPSLAYNFFIVNTAESHKPGNHYVACIIDKNLTERIFFDSFNLDPEFYSKSFANFFTKTAPFRVQNGSRLCALFCVCILHFVGRGFEFPQFIHDFFSPTALVENENLLIGWFKRQKYGSILKNFCPTNAAYCLSFDELLKRTEKWNHSLNNNNNTTTTK